MNAQKCLIDYISDWIRTTKQYDVKPATRGRLEMSMNTLEEYEIAHIPMCEVTTEDFQNYVSELVGHGYSLSTIKKQMLIVSAPMKYAYQHRDIRFNPCEGVKVPSETHIRKKSKHIEAYDEFEQCRLKKELSKHLHSAYYALELLIETGMRAGELLALKWNDIDISRRRLSIHATMVNLTNKNRCYIQEGAKSKTSNRVIPLSRRACEILEDLRGSEWSDRYFLFLNADGEHVSYAALRYQCRQVCDISNVPYYGLHAFRHTFATNQYYKGTDVKILSKLLGHANTSITYNTYIHLYGDGFEEMLKAID